MKCFPDCFSFFSVNTPCAGRLRSGWSASDIFIYSISAWTVRRSRAELIFACRPTATHALTRGRSVGLGYTRFKGEFPPQSSRMPTPRCPTRVSIQVNTILSVTGIDQGRPGWYRQSTSHLLAVSDSVTHPVSRANNPKASFFHPVSNTSYSTT